MKELAPGVFQIPLTPRNGINAYLLGDVLIDSGVTLSAGKLRKALTGRAITALALTHAHIDHAGAAKQLTAEMGIPYWVGALDAEAARTGDPMPAKPWTERFGHFPGAPVARELVEGDEVAGFTVLDTPGHSPGHVSYWRESDRVLVCGDVFNTMNLITTVPGLHEPPAIFSPDPARNRESMRRLAALEPALMLVGHGPPLRDPAKLGAFAAGLPA
jgi:hydroxyacylglutathione hydrolase